MTEIAVACIADQMEKRRVPDAPSRMPVSDDRGLSVLENLPDPATLNLEVLWDAEWQKNLFDTAIERGDRVMEILTKLELEKEKSAEG